jgi:putative hydrolase of the HAD superfamily
VIRAAVFDLDDTLYSYDTFVDSGFVAVAAYLARLLGADPNDVSARLRAARLAGRRGLELQVVCDAYGLPHACVPRLADVLRFHRPLVTLFPDAARVLAGLRADGWRLGVLTNGHPDVQRAKVKALGVEPLVDCVVYAEEHEVGGKPARRVFEQVLGRLDVAPHRAVMVGDDMTRDVQGALSAGLHAIHVPAFAAVAVSAGPYVAVGSLDEASAVAGRLVPGGRRA